MCTSIFHVIDTSTPNLFGVVLNFTFLKSFNYMLYLFILFFFFLTEPTFIDADDIEVDVKILKYVKIG